MSSEEAFFRLKRNEWKFAVLLFVLVTIALVLMFFLRFKNHFIYGQIAIILIAIGGITYNLKYRSLRAKYRKDH